MKRKIALLFALFTIATASQAAEPAVLGEVAGVWYQTSVPGGTVQAGSMHAWFYDDFYVEVELYMDNVFLGYGVGTWRYMPQNSVACKFTDEDGWSYSGTLKRGVFKGNFRGAGFNPSLGKFVCSDASVVPLASPSPAPLPAPAK